MTRDLTGDFITALASEHVDIAYFFEGEFQSSTIRLWSGFGDITWDSKTWYGNGWFQGVGGIGESSDIKATNIDISLAGVPSSVISLVLNEASQNRPGKLWLGFLDDSGDVIADPYLAFEGKYDSAEINDGSDGAEVSLTYETELIELEKAEERRYTDVCQKGIYPTDKGLEYVTAMTDWDGFWGIPEKSSKKKKKVPEKKKRRK